MWKGSIKIQISAQRGDNSFLLSQTGAIVAPTDGIATQGWPVQLWTNPRNSYDKITFFCSFIRPAAPGDTDTFKLWIQPQNCLVWYDSGVTFALDASAGIVKILSAEITNSYVWGRFYFQNTVTGTGTYVVHMHWQSYSS